MKSDHTQSASLSARYRQQRVQQMSIALQANGLDRISILDVGGTLNFWEMNLQYLPKGLVAEIDIVNILPQKALESELEGVKLRSYEGNALEKSSFRKSEYDLVHSNSVIEHVGNLSAQKKMAEAVIALGSHYWIQTPAKSFPLEPHFYFPFFAYLPLDLRATLLRAMNLGYHQREKGYLESKIICEETRLLTKSEVEHLFPAARVLSERVLFLTKSYTATNLTMPD